MMQLLRRVDPRLFLLFNHLLLIVFGTLYLGLPRGKFQIFFCFFVGIVTELVLAKITKRKTTLYDRLISSAVAAAGLLILVRAESARFYGVMALFAILSKYIIRDEHRRHIFNPTNFAIVTALAFFPSRIYFFPDQYAASPWLYVMILFWGTLAVVGSRRWGCTVGYFMAVVLLGLPLGLALKYQAFWVLGPEINVSTLIFTLLMITDPKSSPQSIRAQLVFGGTIAMIHLVLRYLQIPYSPFVALFVVTGLRSVWSRDAGQLSRANTSADGIALESIAAGSALKHP